MYLMCVYNIRELATVSRRTHRAFALGLAPRVCRSARLFEEIRGRLSRGGPRERPRGPRGKPWRQTAAACLDLVAFTLARFALSFLFVLAGLVYISTTFGYTFTPTPPIQTSFIPQIDEISFFVFLAQHLPIESAPSSFFLNYTISDTLHFCRSPDSTFTTISKIVNFH